MKILSNGFNLYGQLGTSEYFLDKFTHIFEGYAIEDLNINHSFSILKNDGKCKLIYKNAEISIDNCERIAKICSNDERVILLNNEGQLFKIDIADNNAPHEISNIISCDEKIENISCGSKITVVYTDKGCLYNVPNRLNFNNEGVVDIQCGREHCIVLDKSGNVYTFGRGSRGQLGHAQLDDEPEPLQVAALGGIKIIQIAAGGWHSCALSEQGDLYTWGWNGTGQLGLSKNDSVSVQASPCAVDFPDPQRNVVKVACGSRHTIALLDNNHLFGCGWNKYKQLTNVETEKYNSFTCIRDMCNENVVALSCGPWNSVVLCK